MSIIELAIVEPNTLGERQRVLAELLADRGISDFKPNQLKRDDFGKPFLELDSGQIGYSFSNARFDGGSFGLMALVSGSAIGIDVELWPRRPSDKVFLESVASSEDEAVLRVLGAGDHDAGVALWVIKEAALKCLGEVMIDPRHLAVTPSYDGAFIVGPSLLAGTAIPKFNVALCKICANKWLERLFIFGAAVHKEFNGAKKDFTGPRFRSAGWQLSSL